jgi:hypothetical protein
VGDYGTIISRSIVQSPATTTWNGSTWSNGVPTATVDAVIAGNYTGAGFSAKNLTVNSGVTINNSSDITVNGTFAHAGSFTGSGFVELAGTSAQTASGNFTNLRINNSNGVTLSAATNVSGLLKLQNGTLTTNGNLTLTSTSPSHCACLAKVENGASLNGSVTVQRNLGSGNRWYYVGTSVQNQTFAAWNNISPSQRFTYSALTAANNGWVAANNATAIHPGRGATLRANGGTLSNTGFVTIGNGLGNAAGNFSFEVLFSENGWASNGLKGWNLLGNPYPCTINWENMNRSNVESTYWIWDGLGYQFYQVGGIKGGSNSGNDISQNISSGQGFFLRATSTPASLTVNENAKVPFATQSFFSTQWSNRLSMTLRKESNQRTDRSFFTLDSIATTGYDINTDVVKMPNSDINLSSYAIAEQQLSVNALPLSNISQVPLSVSSDELGNFTLLFGGIETFAEGSQFFLIDHYLNSVTSLTQHAVYSFVINGDAGSQGANRFEIIIIPAGVTSVSSQVKSAQEVSIFPNPNNGTFSVQGENIQQITVFDVTGKEVFAEKINNQVLSTIQLSNVSKGVYLVRILTTDGVTTKKVVVE